MSVSLYGSGNTVIQVLGNSSVGGSGSTSTTAVNTTNATVTITPQSTNSKILVTVSGYLFQSLVGGTNIISYTQLNRGATQLTTSAAAAQSGSGGIQVYAPFSFVYLDSPATTSATTYLVQQFSSTAATTLTTSNVWIVVQEISGS
jgi:hypothetical protein